MAHPRWRLQDDLRDSRAKACRDGYPGRPPAPGSQMSSRGRAPSGRGHTVSLGGNTFSKTVAVEPRSITFGRVKVGLRSRIDRVVLTNRTDSSVRVTGPIPAPAPLSVVPGGHGCSPAPLASSASCAVSIQFDPTVAGDFATLLTITDQTTGAHNVTLTGKGT
jgi:hypothetical protein